MANPKRVVFVDAGIFYAFIDRRDQDYLTVSTLLKQAEKQAWDMVTSNFVVAETHALILSKLGRALAAQWLESIPQVSHIERVTYDDESRVLSIIKPYEDKDFSYTDATSFALMERLKITEVFSLDKHFVEYGRFAVQPLGAKRRR